jgi:hypothetical protein
MANSPNPKWTRRKNGRDEEGVEGLVVAPFDPFELPRHGLTFNFANFFSPVRITRGTTLRPRRKGGFCSPGSPLHFLSPRERAERILQEGAT